MVVTTSSEYLIITIAVIVNAYIENNGRLDVARAAVPAVLLVAMVSPAETAAPATSPTSARSRAGPPA